MAAGLGGAETACGSADSPPWAAGADGTQGTPGPLADGASSAAAAGDAHANADAAQDRSVGSDGNAGSMGTARDAGADGASASAPTDAPPGRGLDGPAPTEAAAARPDATAAPDATSVATGDAGWWKPPAGGTTWQWQLSGTLDTSLDVAMYDIDLFTNDASTIAALKARHIKVVCYIDVGTYEPGRPDSSQFPAAVIGADVQGWPGEKWLDVTAPAVEAIMQARFQLAAQKGCDGVEPDNVDSYQNSPGFPTTAAQQATFNAWVAQSVHALGMAVALKNDTGQVTQLEPMFDFALVEQCFQYSECSALAPFTRANKAVFEVEYGDAGLATTICPQASSDRFDSLVKDLNLDAWRVSCE